MQKGAESKAFYIVTIFERCVMNESASFAYFRYFEYKILFGNTNS